MTQPPSVLLFDVMDTLVHDPYRQMPHFFGMSWQELAETRKPDSWIDFELGHIDEATFLDGFLADGRPFDQTGFLALFQEGYRWLPGVEELLSDLHIAGHEMHVLSNYPLWYQRIEAKLQLSTYLPWTFVSCHTGIRKPAPEAFLRAANSLERDPGQCLFIDNMEKNCRGAQSVGMDALLFVDSDSLRQDLSTRHLL